MGTATTVAVVVGSAAVLGVGGYFLLRKRGVMAYGAAPLNMPYNLAPPPAGPAFQTTPKSVVGSAIAGAGGAQASKSLSGVLGSYVGGIANQYIPGVGGTAAKVATKVVGKTLGTATKAVSSVVKKFKFW